ncbi:hypothetical protein SAY87_001286 [Trapa incisa]|uniref:Uncharacterized protein n=1 Tax=Trapa incisa TaxID=236973 RepID=A0AAN7GCZ5_9MYRT|nr:hypothetical protein SAY87_001286 [Trapa incisa]
MSTLIASFNPVIYPVLLLLLTKITTESDSQILVLTDFHLMPGTSPPGVHVQPLLLQVSLLRRPPDQWGTWVGNRCVLLPGTDEVRGRSWWGAGPRPRGEAGP